MAESVLAGPGGDAIRAQSPFGRVAEPEEVAEAAAFLCLGAGGFCSTYGVSGGGEISGTPARRAG